METTTPVWLKELYGILSPLLQLLVLTVGPILVTWVSVRLTAVLNVKEEKDKAELEKAIRDALHASSQNAWMFALKKLGLSFTDIKSIGDQQLLQTLAAAREYVKDKNPEGLAKLGVTDKQLEDILISKLPSSVQT